MMQGISLHDRLAALQAERVRRWDPAELQVNIDKRAYLLRHFDPHGTPQPGDPIAPFTLVDTAGSLLQLDQLMEHGPAVLVFFRFAGCPACNITLPYYQQHLAPALRAMGVPLVAVSPQVPERLRDIREQHGLNFIVATDLDNVLGRRLGFVYGYDKASRQAAQRKGRFIGDVTGTGTWELPMPAVVIIDQRCRLRFIDVSPDWLVRTEADIVIEAVRHCQQEILPA
jgi:peroxiredoxin